MKNSKHSTIITTLTSAFDSRIVYSENDNQRDFNISMKAKFLALTDAQCKVIQSNDIDLLALAERILVTNKKDSLFIAQYAVEKIIKALNAIASGSVAQFDKYTYSIVKNLVTLHTLDNLNTQRTICSNIALDELAQISAIKVYHNCSPSTASTQASSTRMMLQALNICNVVKCAKSDTISFTDNLSAQVLQTMFA